MPPHPSCAKYHRPGCFRRVQEPEHTKGPRGDPEPLQLLALTPGPEGLDPGGLGGCTTSGQGGRAPRTSHCPHQPRLFSLR